MPGEQVKVLLKFCYLNFKSGQFKPENRTVYA